MSYFLRNSFPYILITTFSLLFTISYISMEDGVYWSDMSGYWFFWEWFYQQFVSDPISAFQSLFISIRNDDYNYSPIVLGAIFNVFPIESRLSYIISNTVLYIIPCAVLYHHIMKALSYNKKFPLYISLCLFVTYSSIWIPTLRGYPDIIGFLPILISLIIILKVDFSKKVYIKYILIIAFLLYAPFLFRRWYAHTIISMYLSFPVLNYFLFNSSIEKRKLIKVGVNFTLAGVISVILLLSLQYNLIIRVINTNYAEIYSAYQDGILSSFDRVYFYAGKTIFFLFLTSIVIGVVSLLLQDKRCGFFIIFCFFNLIVSFLLFSKVQSPGMQHNLPFSLWMILSIGAGINIIIHKVSKIIGILVANIILCIQFLGLLYVFFNISIVQNIGSISSVQTLPIKLTNYSEYVKLSNIAWDLLKNSNEKLTVLSSSDILNEGLFVGVNRNLSPHISAMSHVDLRDLFNMEALRSKYIIVTDPAQTHLLSGQNVIIIPNNSIRTGEDIGQAYHMLAGPFAIGDNVNAYLYEKHREFTVDELDQFFSKFYSIYPDWKEIMKNQNITN